MNNYVTIYRCNNCSSIFSMDGSNILEECNICSSKDFLFFTLEKSQKEKFTKEYHKNRGTGTDSIIDPREAFKETIRQFALNVAGDLE